MVLYTIPADFTSPKNLYTVKFLEYNTNEVIALEQKPPVGRFAPTPSGRMHLGNVFAALIAWLSVRSRGGSFILRV